MKKKNLFIFLFAVLLVALILPITVHAADTTVKEISTHEQLADAIKDQADNQTWKIKAGTYTLTQEDLNKYKDWGTQSEDDSNASKAGQGNWYFPIHKNNIKIIGEGDVTITSNVETTNGAWASQDFVSVWGDNVTIENVDFLCKKEQNKVIEIMGKNFTLKNSTMKKVDKDGSGSIYFNAQNGGDIGNAVLENVKLYAWVTAANTANTSGTLKTSNVTIDFTDNEYAGYSDEELGYAWRPLIAVNDKVKAENSNFRLLVDDKINLTEQVFMEKLPENTTVVLTKDVSIDKMLNIQTNNVTLDLNGNTLTASENFTSTWENNNDAHLLQVLNATNVTIKNGSVVTTDKNKHGINIFDSEDVILEDLAVDNTQTIGGAPIVINNSSTNIKGDLDLTLGENSWYGINVDPHGGKASLIFNEGSTVTMNGSEKLPAVYIDEEDRGGNDITIIGAEAAGLATDENGNFIISEKPTPEPTPAKPAEKDETPKTGSIDVALVASMISVISFAGVVAIKKYSK